MSSSYKLLVSLGIFNVNYSFMISVGLADYFYDLEIFTRAETAYTYIYLMLFSVSSCAWFTASLSFFYFIKISHFKSVFFAWVKRKISILVPWMLLLDIFVSLCNSFLSSLVVAYFQSLSKSSNNSTSLVFTLSQLKLVHKSYSSPSVFTALSQLRSTVLSVLVTDTIIPVLVLVTTTACTIVTLRKHHQGMEAGMITADNDHQKSYEKVVSRMMHSLFSYGMFYFVMLIFSFAIMTQLQDVFWLFLIVVAFFSVLQSVLLIIANPRLKEAWNGTFLSVHNRVVKHL
ncbi:taste receptor type 2 member 39-like [Hyperolius riggenbachi]|uniref:taste receptor type 2 member 39-like n=1 Tax=Hyperolius riggenbachi TaxID=752182 RepID=UPI0035A31045